MNMRLADLGPQCAAEPRNYEYADDVMLFVETKEGAKNPFRTLIREKENTGLKVDAAGTMNMKISRILVNTKILKINNWIFKKKEKKKKEIQILGINNSQNNFEKGN